MVNATNNDCAGSHGSPDRVEPAWRSLLSDHVSHVKQAEIMSGIHHVTYPSPIVFHCIQKTRPIVIIERVFSNLGLLPLRACNTLQSLIYAVQ